MLTKLIPCKCYPSEDVGTCPHYELCHERLIESGTPGYEKEEPLWTIPSPT